MGHVVLDVCPYATVTQILDNDHVRINADASCSHRSVSAWAHPPESELMARVAGLRLRERWGDCNGEPFTAASWRYVSVYERAPGR